jgi:hypothetical protein
MNAHEIYRLTEIEKENARKKLAKYNLALSQFGRACE